MDYIAKSTQPKIASITTLAKATANENKKPLDPKLQRIRDAAAKGDYQRALEMLAADSYDLEIRNCRAVCLIRLQRFEQAYGVLRPLIVNSVSQTVRAEAPDHIKINFAIALFYGGLPSGAMDVLLETNREDDPAVQKLREATKEWVAGMGFLRRLDWKVNRIAPKTQPTVPQETMGRFSWEVA